MKIELQAQLPTYSFPVPSRFPHHIHFNALTCINLRPDCFLRLHINNKTLPLCLPSSSSSRVTSLSEVPRMYVCRNQCLLCARASPQGSVKATTIYKCTRMHLPARNRVPVHARIASHRIVTRHRLPNVSQRTSDTPSLVPTTALASISDGHHLTSPSPVIHLRSLR